MRIYYTFLILAFVLIVLLDTMEKTNEQPIITPKRRKRTSLAQLKACQTNPLIDGRRSKLFTTFCAKHGLDMKDIELSSTGKLSLDINNAIKLLHERDKKMRVLLDYYKSTGARGLQLFDQWVDLNARLVELEAKYKRDGKNILEWEQYPRYVELQLKLARFLESINWDKRKFEQEHQLKRMQKGLDTTDDLFVIDAEFTYPDDNDNDNN